MKIVANNKKAFFDYEISEKFLAGVSLVGSEVKSIRAGGVNLVDSFVIVKNGEVFWKHGTIRQFAQTSSFAPDEKRDRKLLLNRSEIDSIVRLTQTKGLFLVPLKIGFCGPYVKFEIGLGKSKRKFDKRNTLKEKAAQKEMDSALKKAKQAF